MLDLKPDDLIPAEKVASVKLGTTVATNALLERKGERTVLVITRGLGDVLKIGTQQRPRLFDLKIVLPEPLYERDAGAVRLVRTGAEPPVVRNR